MAQQNYLRLGDTAPDFEADSTQGRISFHKWKEGKWAILFSHPGGTHTSLCGTLARGSHCLPHITLILFNLPNFPIISTDYTPVCTTELGMTAKLQPEFAKKNTLVIGLSVDNVDDHHGTDRVSLCARRVATDPAACSRL